MRATNPLFDKINAVLNNSNDGYSDVKIFNVTCKNMQKLRKTIKCARLINLLFTYCLFLNFYDIA